MKKRIMITGLFLMTLMVLSGCGKKISRTLFAMDTVMEISYFGAETVMDEVEDCILMLDKKLSVTNDESLVTKLNQEKQIQKTDADIEKLIRLSLEISNDTDGAMDITVYPIVKAWGFTKDNHQVPTESEITKLLNRVGYTRVSLDGDYITVADDTEIDLGCIAKGYAADEVCRILQENGIKSALLSLGGNVQTIGRKPDGSKWKIAITDPDNLSDYIGYVEIENKAVVTSAGYQRYFEEDGIVYHHIIDTKTGYPASNGIKSATIIGDSGAMCDGLSTAVFVMGIEKAQEYYRQHPDYEMVIVDNNSTIYVTMGIKKQFNVMNGAQIKVIE